MPFSGLDDLALVYIDGRKWRLLYSLVYVTRAGERVIVPSGFETDFASVPRALYSLFPATGRGGERGDYGPAAIVHDYIYQTHAFSRARADAIFLEAMQDLGVAWITRRLMYPSGPHVRRRRISQTRALMCDKRSAERARHRQHYRQLRNAALDALGARCECCGETRREFLNIDHINDDGAAERRRIRGTAKFLRELRRNGYPRDRYRVLCANCNMARGLYGVCPHVIERAESLLLIEQS